MKPVHLSFDKRVVLAMSVAAALSGCGLFQSSDPEYKGLQRGTSLEIPPDLSKLQRDDRYTVPGAATASQMAAASGAQAGSAGSAQPVLPTIKIAHIERDGNQRWLVVDRAADQVYDNVHEFWLKNGFKLEVEDRSAGILETEWTQDKARMPRTGLRAFLGKLGDSIFDTGLRDRYRTRLERVGNTTEVYISQRGAEEIMNSTRDQTVWQPRPNDPNLEAEYLQKLEAYLAGADSSAKPAAAGGNATAPAAAAAPTVERAKLVKNGSTSYVEIDDGFDRAWRRVGLALDRSGFTVEERDKAGGRYVVRYVDPDQDKDGPGFFAKLFGSAKDVKPVQYRVFVRPQGSTVQVSVQPVQAPADKLPDASPRILQLLHDELK